MALTIEQLSLHTGDKFKKAVLENILKRYYLMSLMEFDNSAVGNDISLNYVYSRVDTDSGADVREINKDFTESEAKLKRVTTTLKALGGNFGVDNSVAGSNNAASIVEFQMNQKIKATIQEFYNLLVNGTTSVGGFEGIDKLLTTAEFKGQVVDAGSFDATGVVTDADAYQLLEFMDNMILNSDLKGGNGVIVANTKSLLKLKAAARRVGNLSQLENAFGITADFYNGVPLLDLGTAGGKDIVGINTETGETSIYGIRLGMDALHGVSPMGSEQLFTTTLPDFKAASAVGKSVAYGLVQMVVSFAIRDKKALSVVKGVKVDKVA